jgi:hypothetical protein
MFHLSHLFSFAAQDSHSLKDLPETSTIQEERVRELEAEVRALQGLVCYLLEKNECLRVRIWTS